MSKGIHVSYKVAKLLREKEFGMPMGQNSAPTYQEVEEWLRQKHNIHIVVNIYPDCSTDADGNIVDEWVEWGWSIYSTLTAKCIYDDSAQFGGGSYDSHKEANEAALIYCLKKLI